MPIFPGDFPQLDEALPKFLDDPTAAKFMAALAADPNRRRRLMVELLARTGMRAGELAALRDDAMIRIGDTFWLRVPVGKLHNDRYVPLHPILVELITSYRHQCGPTRTGLLVERNDGQPFERRTIARYVAAVARRAGVGHVHPHQLRHTLATQAINRGMSLEAIAALLGHRTMRMTLVYARISDGQSASIGTGRSRSGSPARRNVAAFCAARWGRAVRSNLSALLSSYDRPASTTAVRRWSGSVRPDDQDLGLQRARR